MLTRPQSYEAVTHEPEAVTPGSEDRLNFSASRQARSPKWNQEEAKHSD